MFGDDELLGDLTILIGIISALAGYLGTWWKDREDRKKDKEDQMRQFTQTQKLQDRQSKLTRVNAQLKSLFGPMRMLDIACFQAVTPLARLYGCNKDLAANVEEAIKYLANCASENPASKLAHDYRYLIRNSMIVNLKAMSDIVQVNGDLFDGFVPEWVFHLEAYLAEWNLIIHTWDVLYFDKGDDKAAKADRVGASAYKKLCEDCGKIKARPRGEQGEEIYSKEDKITLKAIFTTFLADKGITQGRKPYSNVPEMEYSVFMVKYVSREYGRLKQYQLSLLNTTEKRNKNDDDPWMTWDEKPPPEAVQGMMNDKDQLIYDTEWGFRPWTKCISAQERTQTVEKRWTTRVALNKERRQKLGMPAWKRGDVDIGVENPIHENRST